MTNLPSPGELNRVPIDPRAHEMMFRDLARIDRLSSRLDHAVLSVPPDSIAASELTDKIRAYAHDHAATAIRASLDHLRAWQRLLAAGEMPAYAHLSLLRTAHEAALFACWLVEPTMDPDTRRARGIAAQAADYDERRKVEEAIGLTVAPPPGKLATDRKSDLMAIADSLGLVRDNSKGQPILTTVVPGTVELFDHYEPVKDGAKAQFIYRLYSGYAHAKQWALTQGAQQQAPYDASGRTVALVQGSDAVAVGATRRAVNALERALAAYELLRVGN